MTKFDVTTQEPAEETPGEIEVPEVVAYYTEDELMCSGYSCNTLHSS